MKQEAKGKHSDFEYGKKSFKDCMGVQNNECSLRKRTMNKLDCFMAIFYIILILEIIVLVSILSYRKPKIEKKFDKIILIEDIQTNEDKHTINDSESRLSATEPSKNYYYHISEDEKVMIAKLVWAEARGESYEGKVAIAAVVLNRYRFEENQWDFDNDTISSVILQKNQFASISNVDMQDLKEYPDCIKAVEDACKGWDPTRKVFEDGALYFYNPILITGRQKEIRNGIQFMAIGNHNFHIDFNYEN